MKKFLVPIGDTKFYKSPFLRDFWHLNVAMMTSNNALIPDPDKYDVLASSPLDWPLMHLGLRMCGWGDNQIKYYLMGNPVIWWGGTVSLVASLVTLVVYLLRQQRKYVDMDPSTSILHLELNTNLTTTCRRMGSFPIRREDRFLWLVLPLR